MWTDLSTSSRFADSVFECWWLWSVDVVVFLEERGIKDFAWENGFVGLFSVGGELLNNVRVCFRDILTFLDIFGQIIELPSTALGRENGLPMPRAYGAPTTGFPIKVLVFGLLPLAR